MPRKNKTMDVSPEQARFTAALLKHRFPWLGTRKYIDLADAVTDLAEFHELLSDIGKKPEPPITSGQRIAERLKDLLLCGGTYEEMHAEILDELVATRKGLR